MIHARENDADGIGKPHAHPLLQIDLCEHCGRQPADAMTLNSTDPSPDLCYRDEGGECDLGAYPEVDEDD